MRPKAVVYTFANFKEGKKKETKKKKVKTIYRNWFQELKQPSSSISGTVFSLVSVTWLRQLQSAQIKWDLGAVYHRPCHLKHLHKGHNVCLSSLSHKARSEHWVCQSAAFCVCWGHAGRTWYTPSKSKHTKWCKWCLLKPLFPRHSQVVYLIWRYFTYR